MNPITVDLIPKKRSRRSQIISEIRDLATNLYVAMSFLPILAFLSLFGILYFYNIQIKDESLKIIGEIDGVEKQVDLDKKAEMEAFSGRLDALKFLLDNHTRNSKVFKLVEDLTHKRASFNAFEFGAEDGSLIMSGVTENYKTLGEQIIAFERSKDVSDLSITNVNLEFGGEVVFTVSFKVNESIYK
ncbi:MAG: hypothetical protein A3B96_03900 [Candidatus Spechtbacteria bacterium RIFCSPHIGHO2_02_FULL_43_15b]|uniref:Fimbrial assembly protein n=1 Tax=Candidatus Spechtbacteria bacterium RIFCSPHIGHO2_01_FULL_43_30 TaxID=1802158 RepID=A0A1G2H866_9BACT|nr:MAG: hypothetical protein A2827_03415 [Candidatus Spechtbacteria bacterium RIFCSPHIGHO2_01_FULL_43_30]OGZ59151.1 MAG: hypothetical protein A3B96_03900 [Candidatus Spechtbacteria bacterium RIFCSPHIGHO2_02_FULL_43_15b]